MKLSISIAFWKLMFPLSQIPQMGIQPQQPHFPPQNLSAEDAEPMAHSSVFITIVPTTGGYVLVSTEVGRRELLFCW